MTALKERNAENRLVLDNVSQGFLTIDGAGSVSPEYSAALARGFGAPRARAPGCDFLARLDPPFGAFTRLALEEVVADTLPLESTLPQMPRRLGFKGRHYDFAYESIAGGGDGPRFLVVVTDVTSDEERQTAERDLRETHALFERMLADRSGVVAFFEEASKLVERVLTTDSTDLPAMTRALHTLKGNCGFFGLESVAAICHALETHIVEERAAPTEGLRLTLSSEWARIGRVVERLRGERRQVVEVAHDEYGALTRAARAGVSNEEIVRMLRHLELEPTSRRLLHFSGAGAPHRRAPRQGGGTRGVDRGPRPPASTAIAGRRSGEPSSTSSASAVDHGIEGQGPDGAAAGSKAPQGKLSGCGPWSTARASSSSSRTMAVWP